MIFLTVLPIFLLIGVGALLKFMKVADDRWIEVLNKFALYLGFPALIFSNLATLDPASSLSYKNFFLTLGILIISTLVVYLITTLLKVKKEVRNCYVIGLMFGNVAYIGFPFVTSLLKDAGPEVSLIVAAYLIVLFTLGLFILESSSGKKVTFLKIIKDLEHSPLLIAVILGLIFVQLKVALPSALLKSIKLLADAASPVVLVSLGIFLVRKIEWNKELFHGLTIGLLKIIVLPLLFFIVHFFVKGDFVVPILEAGMPTGVTLFALSQGYKVDKKVIVYAIVISTIFSMITLPLLSSLVL